MSDPTYPGLTFVLVCLVVIVVAFVAMTARLFLKRKFLTAAGSATLTLVGVLVTLFILSVSMNLYTYKRLTSEQPVAQAGIQQTGIRQFKVTISDVGGSQEIYEINGDEWQLDVRIIKWTGIANLAGLDTVYRMERLSGRFADIHQEKQAPKSVYSLSDSGGIDIWSLTKGKEDWMPWIDTVYGSAVYLPLADGASFEISLAQSGLLARAVNNSAKKALKHWR